MQPLSVKIIHLNLHLNKNIWFKGHICISCSIYMELIIIQCIVGFIYIKRPIDFCRVRVFEFKEMISKMQTYRHVVPKWQYQRTIIPPYMTRRNKICAGCLADLAFLINGGNYKSILFKWIQIMAFNKYIAWLHSISDSIIQTYFEIWIDIFNSYWIIELVSYTSKKTCN